MTTYVTFTEHNDAEGETWRFYIPTDGNETALAELRSLVEKTGSEAYHLDLWTVAEAVVDARVSLGDGDYMAAHTKLTGTLTVPDAASEAHADDLLYKGGITGLVA